MEGEASYTSQRSQSLSKTSSIAVHQATKGLFDFTFPLLEEVNTAVPPVESLSTFTQIIKTIQQFACFSLMYYPGVFDIEGDGIKVFRGLFCLGDFGNTYFSNSFSISTIIGVGLSVIQALVFILVLTYYHRNKVFPKVSLYIIRAMFSFLSILLVIPMGIACGRSFYIMSNTYSIINIVSFVLTLICWIVNCFILYIGIYISSFSPFINNVTFGAWDGSADFISIILSSFVGFMQYFAAIYPNWCHYIFFILCDIAHLYDIYQILKQPYLKPFANSFYVTTQISCFFLLLLSLCPFGSKTGLISILAALGIFVILNIVGVFVLKKLYKKICTDKNMRTDIQCIQLLRIFLLCEPQEFITWDLLKEVTVARTSSAVLLQSARVLTFFPSESHTLGHFISLLNYRSDLKTPERFSFNQIQKVYLLRQSSVSHQLNSDFSAVQKQTNQMINYVRNFWLNCQDHKPKLSIGLLNSLHGAVKRINETCLEYMSKYPNASRFTEEYSRFLIECKGDFQNGTLMHHKAELIEAGHHDTIDYAFRFFANCFPVYLKKNILDYKGKIVSKKKGKMGGSSNLSQSSSSNNAMDPDDDLSEAAIDDQAAKIISSPKLRLALQRAVTSVPNHTIFLLTVLHWVKFVVFIVIFLLLGVGFLNFFNSRQSMLSVSSSLGKYRLRLALTMYAASLQIAEKLDLTPTKEEEYAEIPSARYEKLNTTTFGDSHQNMLYFIERSLDESFSLSVTFSDVSVSDLSFIEYAKPFLTNGTLNLCRLDEDETVYEYEGYSYSVVTRGNYEAQEKIGTKATNLFLLGKLPDIEDIADTPTKNKYEVFAGDPSMCQIMINFNAYTEALELQAAFIQQKTQKGEEDEKKQLTILRILLPILIGSIFIALFIFSFIKLLIDFNHFVKMIEGLPRSGLEQAAQPLTNLVKQDTDSTNATLSLEASNYPFILLTIATLGVTLSGVLLLYINFTQLIRTTTELTSLTYYLTYASNRLAAVVESLTAAVFTPIAYYAQEKFENINFIALMTAFIMSKEEVIQNNGKLVNGQYSILGFSDAQDHNNFQEDCGEFDHNDDFKTYSFHDSIVCMSVTRLMAAYNRLIDDYFFYCFTCGRINAYENPEQPLMCNCQFSEENNVYYGCTAPSNLHSSQFLNLKHAFEYHIFPRAYEGFLNLQSGSQTILNNLWGIYYLVFSLVFVFWVICFVIESISITSIANAFHESQEILCRLEPHFVLSQPSLMSFITGHETKQTEVITSAEQSVIDASPDSIISVGSELSLETMNPTTTVIFGYTPEQLIGQSLQTLIPNQDKASESFYRQISLMKAHQVGMTYSSQLKGVRDDGSFVTLDITLLGINEAESFALIMKDQTEAQKAQQEVEKAKAHAEQLLYQILPRDIVNRINSKEKDISFTVNSATVIFIDVVKFSEFTASLSAKEILNTLGTIFKTYDSSMIKYKTIIKIKVIGDTYMGAAGLFTPNQPPRIHATEMVSFALEAVGSLDEINRQFNSNLQVRVGINSGGPLIAGVLGTDKPLFDIIGDPINVAARLQSTSLNNHIQISQGTYELIKDSGFNIQERGQVQLKGKGLQMAYFVMPDEHANHLLDEISSPRENK